MSAEVTNVFSVDVEDWFHILDLDRGIARDDWSNQESRVEQNTSRLLDLLERHRTSATCFVLGWIAERHPGLIRAIDRQGHEIATHGYGHELIYELGADAFRNDVTRSLEVLGSIVGTQPRGYRAPGFSVTEETPWAFSVLGELGINYDSSVFPAVRGHGGIPGGQTTPYRIELAEDRELVELPITTAEVLGRRVAYCGGGYLRLFPLAFISRAIRRANRAGISVVLYVHPRDIDPDQFRIPMSAVRRFKSYVGLRKAHDKLNALLQEFPFGRADQLVASLASDDLPRIRLPSETAGP